MGLKNYLFAVVEVGVEVQNGGSEEVFLSILDVLGDTVIRTKLQVEVDDHLLKDLRGNEMIFLQGRLAFNVLFPQIVAFKILINDLCLKFPVEEASSKNVRLNLTYIKLLKVIPTMILEEPA